MEIENNKEEVPFGFYEEKFRNLNPDDAAARRRPRGRFLQGAGADRAVVLDDGIAVEVNILCGYLTVFDKLSDYLIACDKSALAV